MIRWDIQSAQDGAGGAKAIRNSDNLKIPNRETARAARQALERYGFTTIIGNDGEEHERTTRPRD